MDPDDVTDLHSLDRYQAQRIEERCEAAKVYSDAIDEEIEFAKAADERHRIYHERVMEQYGMCLMCGEGCWNARGIR